MVRECGTSGIVRNISMLSNINFIGANTIATGINGNSCIILC
jgi:hypothetical protein